MSIDPGQPICALVRAEVIAKILCDPRLFPAAHRRGVPGDPKKLEVRKNHPNIVPITAQHRPKLMERTAGMNF